VAEHGGALRGVLTFVLGETDCEILTLHAAERFRGTGSALIEAVERLAADAGCHPPSRRRGRQPRPGEA